MPAFVSPLDDPASWSYSIVEATIPTGLRYGNYAVRGLRAQHSAGANIVSPCLGLLRRADLADGKVVVEVQVSPVPIRQVVITIPWGLPTFYFIFSDATGVSVAGNQMAPAGEVIRATQDVTILMVPQDRFTRDPALWTSDITTAVNVGGGNVTIWEPFATAVNEATNTGPSAPVLVLDHTGAPQPGGNLDLVFGPSETFHAVLEPVDGGDLQKAVTRMHAADPNSMPIPNLWSTADSFQLRPVGSGDSNFQLVALENPSASSAGEITVTPANRHISITNLNDWFAPQFATPVGAAGPALQRYTPGNLVKPLINGIEFFDDFFGTLQQASVPGGGVHLAGWSMFPDTELTERDDVPKTLKAAAEQIGSAGGSCRFLAAQFFQVEDGAELENEEILVFEFLIFGILILSAAGVSAVRTDPAGTVILVGLLLGNLLLQSKFFDEGGSFLEPNRDAVEVLDPIDGTNCHLSPFPATVDDNTAVPQPVSGFPFDTLFQVLRHFGIYHQKFAVVRAQEELPAENPELKDIGYCGGIDVNPNRLDDANHLIRSPYHDVHCRVEGRAARDLAISFQERWSRDGHGFQLAFDVQPDNPQLQPGSNIVQVARTYFAPADPVRRLAFAPDGDRTILNTMQQALSQAKEFVYIEDQYFNPPEEYNAALLDCAARVRKLIIVIPSLPDQPLGDVVRTQLMNDLRLVDQNRGGGIVHLGYPRRRYTVSDNDLRTSSGKCTLAETLTEPPGLDPTIALFPESRVPIPPFWVSVAGELMWAYDESPQPTPPNSKRLRVERGDRTRLFKTAGGLKGPTTREHRAGAAATIIDLSGIYVHAKMMIVDDVFLGIGSANLNRRGLFHDGEINVFSLPEAMKAIKPNPVAQFRQRLWAEMCDLPEKMIAPLLADPIAGARLFERSPLTGNRIVDCEALPATLMLDATTGDALITTLLQGFMFTVGAIDHIRLFDAVIDPSSRVESA
jgi:phosphatidylserine/phosphatidylglycerophosphate/cardiolipin synthase-like enzyme